MMVYNFIGFNLTEREDMKSILAKDISLAEHTKFSYRVFVEQETTIEDIKRPEFWAHVVKSHFDSPYSVFPHVEVIWKDNSKIVDLVVVAVAEAAALVHIKNVMEIHSGNAVVKTTAGDFEIKWGGPKALWRVYRKSDAAIISELNASKEDAQKALDEYLAKITKAA